MGASAQRNIIQFLPDTLKDSPRNQGTLYMEQEQVWECPFGGSPGSTGLAAEGHGFVQVSRAQQRQPVTNREAISSADAGVLG